MTERNGNIDIARSLIDKYIEIGKANNIGYSKRFLASILVSENPDKFKNQEHARTCVRNALNAYGNKDRSKKNIDLAARFALMADSA